MFSPPSAPSHGAFPSKRYYPKSNGWMVGENGGGGEGSEKVREGVREREMQFHSRLRQAIDGNSLQMKVISFHLLSIKRRAMLIYSRRQMHSSAAETEIASPVGG